MKAKTTGKREKANRALFMRRTYTMYRHMCERADKATASVPFSLDELRDRVTTLLDVSRPLLGSCRYCTEYLKIKTFSLDHRTPIERGGSWDLSNIDAVCSPCNRAKGTMTGDEFEAVLRVLRTMPGATMRDVLARLKFGGAMKRLVLVKRKAAAA